MAAVAPRLIFPLFLAFLVASTAGAAPTLSVEDPWVKEGPPSARVLAGYMTIRNGSSQTQTIIGVSSPAFAMVEMHRTEIQDGMARMVEQERLEVPASGQVSLEPGGYHLMLMGANRPLREGDTVEISLQPENGEPVVVQAPVRKATLGTHHHH